ncbi:hypothetical protein HIM_07896 [Hirsutella minnesotensis 3608]|uniref:Fungal lipase-type domain-containing protein n=1 Tax=Hirsutella minnesotensis 3608 TaxID=1043627 RepID=A0A0F8A3Z8_9HYPO|nr:hypothetical protein HIM_07896 [Hirsutella minnesotensis 3608]
MRWASHFVVAGALAGTGLADGHAIAAEMRSIRERVEALDKAVVDWPGDVISAGNVVCRAVDAISAFESCSRAIDESAPLTQKEYSESVQGQVLPLSNAILDLTDHVASAKITFVNKETIRLTQYEVLHAQQKPAKEFTKTVIAKLFEKLPKSIRSGSIQGVPLGTWLTDAFVKGFDSNLEKMKPRPGQYSPLAKAVSMVADMEKLRSMDMGPFCRAEPQLSRLFQGQESVSLGRLAEQVNGIFESSGLGEQAMSFDTLYQIAGPLGIPREKIAAGERQGAGMRLGEFAASALDLIKRLGVQEQRLSAAQVNHLINLLLMNLELQAPRPGSGIPPKPKGGIVATPVSQSDVIRFTRYAKLSAAAYHSECRTPPENVQITKNIVDIATGTESFIAIDHASKEIIAAFRGTSDVRDVETDIEMFQIDYNSPGISGCNGCKVHKGFLTSWNSIANQVIDSVKSELAAVGGAYRVTATGHSLGGAVAALASLSLIGSGVPATVYTYGQPRVGNKPFADFLDRQVPQFVRITHANDGVPQIPYMEMGYHHNSGEYHQADDRPESVVQCEGQEPQACINAPENAILGINEAHLSYMGVNQGIMPGAEVVCGM